jgi:hypothetical protein
MLYQTLQYHFLLPSIAFIPYFKLHRSLLQQTYTDIYLLLTLGVLRRCLPHMSRLYLAASNRKLFKPRDDIHKVHVMPTDFEKNMYL